MSETDGMPCSTNVEDLDLSRTTRGIGRKRGILVVDDAGEIRDTLQAGLWHYGFNVWSAASGPEAVASYRINGDSVDMVLLDVRMPDWDGPRTLSALHEVDARVRCCFMSGDLGGHSVPDLIRLGAIHVFAKPFYIRSVVEVMMALIPNDRATNVGEGLWDEDGGNGIDARDPVSRVSELVIGSISKNSGMDPKDHTRSRNATINDQPGLDRQEGEYGTAHRNDPRFP
jgi:DNA-binding response OmpR family regulator